MLHSFTLCLGYFLYLGALHAFHAFLVSEYKCGEIIFLPFSPSKGSESTEVMVLCPQLYNGEPSHVLQSTSKHSRKKKKSWLSYSASVCVPKCCWTGSELLSVKIKSELRSWSTPSTPTAGGCSVFRARVEQVQINHPEIILMCLNSALMMS